MIHLGGLLVLATLPGCTRAPTLLSDDALSDAVDLAGEVDRAALEAGVARMVTAHTADPGTVVEPWGMPHKDTLGEAELVTAFEEVGLEATVEDESGDGWEVHNLVVELPGTSRPEEIVLVSAHYDVWYFGADDNSSGIAVLLEAARILSTREHARTIRIVAFDDEEVGLIGSYRYYRRHEGEDFRVVVNMDAVGFATSAAGSQGAPPGFSLPDVGDFIVALANAPAEREALVAGQIAGALPTPLPMQGAIGTGDNRAAGTGDFHRSDHSGAWNRDIPGVFLSDTTNFRSDLYHTDGDLPDTLDYDFLHRVAQVVVGTTYAFAQEGS